MHRSPSPLHLRFFVFSSIRMHVRTLVVATILIVIGTVAVGANAGEVVTKEKGPFDIASSGRERYHEFTKHGTAILTDVPDTHHPEVPPIKHLKGRLGNVQVNDESLDRFTFSTSVQRVIGRLNESETSIAARGRTIVATYNTSAFPTGSLLESGFSTSVDSGTTWTTGFFPPFQGGLTLGDPVIATDRTGQFYFTGMTLGSFSNCIFCQALGVNTSTDGLHWNDPVAAVVDNGLDKPWLAVGPDPVLLDRDNVYITYSHFGSDFSRVDLTRSLDGAKTWDAPKTIFAPTADAAVTSFIQGTVAYVDPGSLKRGRESFLGRLENNRQGRHD